MVRLWLRIGLVTGALWGALLLPMSAQADTSGLYGRDNYGTCTYQGSCLGATTNGPQPAPQSSASPVVTDNPTPTRGETPGGLEFAINLTDGQTLPPGTYTVTVTPLNGQGSSFDHVVIYLDGHQVATVTPGPDGTVRWPWDVTSRPGSEIRVVVFDKDGRSAMKIIAVKLGGAQVRTIGWFEQSVSAVRRLARTIPLPVLLGFPWLLFILLGLAMMVWVAAIRREVAAIVKLRKLYAAQVELMNLKLGFVRLAAHYLRTPITLIRAGVDALGDTAGALGTGLRGLSDGMAQAVERLLTPLEQQTFQAAQPTPVTARSVVFTPGFMLPIVALMLLVVIFNELASLAGAGLLAAVNLAIQAAAILLLGSMFYGVLRSRRLHSGERAQLDALVAAQAELDRQRTGLMEAALAGLAPQGMQLQGGLAQLPAGPGRQSAENGLLRLRSLLARFDLLGKLTIVTEPPAPALSSVGAVLAVAPVQASIQAAQAKPAQLSLPVEAQLVVRDPWLLGYVLSTLIDNAVAYSSSGASVRVNLTTTEGWQFTVEDNGAGIPSDKLALLFQPFSKAEGALDFTHEGAGLSLYLDRVIMSYLGGTVALESQPGRGTRATVTLSRI
jgi:signal transduction histidine kinase